MPFSPLTKRPGDLIKSADWNDSMAEIVRLENSKMSRIGTEIITGQLTVKEATSVPMARQLIVQGTAGSLLDVRTDTVQLLLGAIGNAGVLSIVTNHDLQLRAGGDITRVTVKANGNVCIGAVGSPSAPLHVADHVAVGPFASRADSAVGRLEVSGPVAELGFIRRTLSAFPATPAPGDRFVWYNPDGSARLFTEQKGDLLTIDGAGNALLIGSLTLKGILATDGTEWIRLVPGAGAGNWNGIVQANDNAIVYSNGTIGQGALVIAPWASNISGIRMDANGNVAIGTTNPGAKLEVAGGIIQKGIIPYGVGNDSGGPAVGADYAFGYQEAGAWTHPYPDLILGYHTGIKMGGHFSYGGIRFYNDHPSRTTTELMSIGNGDQHVRVANDLIVSGGIVATNGIDHVRKSVDQFQDNRTLRSGIYQNSGDGLKNPAGALAFNGWWHVINMHHQNNDGYNAQMAVPLSANPNDILFRTSGAGTWSQWRKVLSENTDGNAGIGTYEPAAKLEVMGGIRHHPAGNTVQMTNVLLGGTKYIEYFVNGSLWGVSMWASSSRYKENITSLELDTRKVFDLKPVSFNWNAARGGQRDFGLIAEEAAKISPFLVSTDKEGKPFSVRYEMLSVLLLNESKKMVDEIAILNETVEKLKAKSGNDFAEFFESVSGKQIKPGTSVILENSKVRPAKKGEIPFGVISANPALLGGFYLEWPNKYLLDEFGAQVAEEYKEEIMVPKEQKVQRERQKCEKKTVTEEITRTEVVIKNNKPCQVEKKETATKEIEEPVFKEIDLYDEKGKKVIGTHKVPVMETYEEEITVFDEKGNQVLVGSGKFITRQRPKLNPDYNEKKEYISRQKRPEWNCVGLLGQLSLKKGQPVAPTWIKIKDLSDDVELWLIK